MADVVAQCPITIVEHALRDREEDEFGIGGIDDIERLVCRDHHEAFGGDAHRGSTDPDVASPSAGAQHEHNVVVRGVGRASGAQRRHSGADHVEAADPGCAEVGSKGLGAIQRFDLLAHQRPADVLGEPSGADASGVGASIHDHNGTLAVS